MSISKSLFRLKTALELARTQTHTYTHAHTPTPHAHTSDEAKLCSECGGLEASSLSNLAGLWLRFRSETQLIYHATLCPLSPTAQPRETQQPNNGSKRAGRQAGKLAGQSAELPAKEVGQHIDSY